VKRTEWLEAGLEPAFGTVQQWMTDQLGALGAEEEACYALLVREKPLQVRVLVATDVGLVDFVWDRPEPVERRVLASTHTPWQVVSAPILTGETRLSPAMIHQPPTWSLRLERPAVEIVDAVDQDALLAFWKACAAACGSLAKVKR
jgi:hypothetical protein